MLLPWGVQTGRIQRCPTSKCSVRVPMQVIIRPKLTVAARGTDFVASTTQSVKKQRCIPPIHQLAGRVQGNMTIRQETFAGSILAAEQAGPVLIGAQRTIGGGLQKQERIFHEPRHQDEIVFGREIGVGVIV